MESAPPAVPMTAALQDNSNPYLVISGRNVFHLNPPPPPPQPDQGTAVLPVVLLSGFMRTGGEAKALLAVKTQNPDPHAPELTSFVALAEGSQQRVGAGDKRAVVELVKIYLEQEKVDIINSGTPITLSLKEDGFNSAKAAAAGRKGTAAIHATPVVVPKPDDAPAADAAETEVLIAGKDKPIVGPLFRAQTASVDREATNTSNAIIVGGAGATTR
jgi:hypothetical protein